MRQGDGSATRNDALSATKREALAARVRRCVEIAGSGNALASSAGIPRRTLENYLAAISEPKAGALSAIAAAVGVNGHWLLTGDGPMLLADLEASGGRQFDRRLMATVIAAVRIGLERANREMAPEDEAELVLAFYDLFENERAPDQEKLIRLVQSAA